MVQLWGTCQWSEIIHRIKLTIASTAEMAAGIRDLRDIWSTWSSSSSMATQRPFLILSFNMAAISSLTWEE
jgi:hypothetical protein